MKDFRDEKKHSLTSNKYWQQNGESKHAAIICEVFVLFHTVLSHSDIACTTTADECQLKLISPPVMLNNYTQ